MHRYHRGHGFESHSSLFFFRLPFHNCVSCVCNCTYITAISHLFILSSSAVQIYEFSYIHFKKRDCLQSITSKNITMHYLKESSLIQSRTLKIITNKDICLARKSKSQVTWKTSHKFKLQKIITKQAIKVKKLMKTS